MQSTESAVPASSGRLQESSGSRTAQRDCKRTDGEHAKVDQEDRIRESEFSEKFSVLEVILCFYQAIEREGEKNPVDRCREIVIEGSYFAVTFCIDQLINSLRWL